MTRSAFLSVRTFLVAAFAALLGAASVRAQTVITLPDSLYTAGDTITWVKRVPAYCEGPAWEPSTGSVYFTQQGANSAANWPIHRVKPGVDTGIIWYAYRQNNGLAFDAQARLIAAQDGRLTRLKQATVGDSGVVDSVLVTSVTNSVTFNQANDLSIGSKGDIYFTALGSAVYYLNTARQLSTVTTNIGQANGIEWLEEQKAVFVNSTQGGVYRFVVDTVTGALGTRTTFISTTAMPGTDGGTVDSHGNRYVASYSQGQIRVFNANGDSIGRITLGNPPGTFNNRAGAAGNADNAVFGGPDLKTLYITGDGGLYSIRLKIAGRPALQPPTALIRNMGVRKIPGTVDALREPRDALGRSVDPTLPGAKLRLIPIPNSAE
jgi:gluconolactonase